MLKGMRPSWDVYFLGIAEAVSVRGDCTRRQVGAVVYDSDHRIVEGGTGYNGVPAGRPGCLVEGACPRGRFSLEEVPSGSSYDTGAGQCIALHAEQNALIRAGLRSVGAEMAITDTPCFGCQKLIAGAGIVRVIYPFGGLIASYNPSSGFLE